jgi:uroporphyrinogen decarboxylase
MSRMTSLERVLTTLSHQEPDRVPLFLLVTMHGAKELGLTIKEYFSKAEYVVEGQLRLREKYRHDCLNPFFYAAIETEAMGGEVLFSENGPPNAGAPILRNHEQIRAFQPPHVKDASCLKRVLQSIETLKEKVGDDAPILGVVMSPFSLPVMQMGFDHYFELMYEEPALFNLLMQRNEEFVVEWANAQLAAGATAICYFDPVSSSSIIPVDFYLRTGHLVAKRTISRIKGPTATHFASGRCLPIINDLASTGTAVISASILEDLAEVKKACKGKMTVLGNLNGVEMCRWSRDEAKQAVESAITKAAKGGGFILSDNHGEIPFQVSDETLHTISETVHSFGKYPIKGK